MIVIYRCFSDMFYIVINIMSKSHGNAWSIVREYLEAIYNA